MNTSSISLLLIANIIHARGEAPTVTGLPPLMEFLDKDLVQVDYSQAFNIPDFSKVIAVNVIELRAKQSYTRGVANRYNYTKNDVILFESMGKRIQSLKENAPIVAMLDPCIEHSSYVRVLYNTSGRDDKVHVDSKILTYKPRIFAKVIAIFF